MALNVYSQQHTVSVSDSVRWRYTAEAVTFMYNHKLYRTRQLWITYREADICIPAAGRILKAARLSLEKLNSIFVFVWQLCGFVYKLYTFLILIFK